MTDIANSSVPIQQESVQFNNPVSESSLASIGAVANYLLQVLAPVGTVWASMLFDGGDGTHPNVNFQAQLGNPSPATWVLCDGRSVVGSTFQSLTGLTNVPDLRGIMIRASNYGGSAAGTRADGKQNPDGTLSPGTYTTDRVGPHTHNLSSFVDGAAPEFGGYIVLTTNSFSSAPFSSTDSFGVETAPRNVTINYFVRIN